MSEKQATLRYFAGFVPAMAIFLGGSLGLAWLDKKVGLPDPVMIALAIVPIVALLSMFWLHWRFLQEIDEYLRQIQINALLCGAAVALAIATGWGYLEQYSDLAALPVFWLNPVFWVAYGIAAAVFTRWAGRR